MEENKEVKQEVEQKVNKIAGDVKKEADRPEENYKAEIERKNREIERLRMLAVQRQEQPKQRDPNDLKTWADHELKAVVNSNDPSVMPYKDQANEILLDRKVDARLARQAETHKRVTADLELKQQFPESLDPTSELSSKIDELTEKYDLDKSPAGRLVAAKLAASELNRGKDASSARAEKTEKDRVAALKANMVDGDRPAPTESGRNLDAKRKELADKLVSGKEGQQVDALSQILKDRGMDQNSFFNKK